jgi:hypothetical protein
MPAFIPKPVFWETRSRYQREFQRGGLVNDLLTHRLDLCFPYNSWEQLRFLSLCVMRVAVAWSGFGRQK